MYHSMHAFRGKGVNISIIFYLLLTYKNNSINSNAHFPFLRKHTQPLLQEIEHVYIPGTST